MAAVAPPDDAVALTVAITTGEPAGVGPELTLAALARGRADARWPDTRFVVLGDGALLAARASAVGVDWQALLANGQVVLADVPAAVPVVAGRLDARNGAYVLALLDAAIDGARAGDFDAIVTAPLQKSTINDAGVPFTGHTEYLAERTATEQVVMMLAGTGERPLRVALATTHLPLSQVAGALSRASLVRILTIIDADLRRGFGIAAPRILVTGLNPHAGENGYLGREEIDVISPAIEQARAAGIDARGPYPADTLFQPRHLADADCVLAMFHDQGLPVLKYATFGAGINITLGLPIIRTSVDHGTALDLAGSGRADPGSMLAALDTAVQMGRHRRRPQPA
nr:4-hydroxythreonine-4-phosphate dehydrogenase PdxA [Robbsia betulipollinis]